MHCWRPKCIGKPPDLDDISCVIIEQSRKTIVLKRYICRGWRGRERCNLGSSRKKICWSMLCDDIIARPRIVFGRYFLRGCLLLAPDLNPGRRRRRKGRRSSRAICFARLGFETTRLPSRGCFYLGKKVSAWRDPFATIARKLFEI